MSEKMYGVQAYAGTFIITINGLDTETYLAGYFADIESAIAECDILNTAADAWKARETKSDSLKSMFAKYTRLYEASEHPFSSFYGNILHELRSIAAELGIELEK